MLDELRPQIAEGQLKTDTLGRSLDIEGKRAAIAGLEAQTLAEGFWNDREAAQAILGEINRRKEVVNAYQQVCELGEEAAAAVELAAEDEDFAAEAVSAGKRFLTALEQLELAQLLSGEYDDHDALLSVHAGAGGLEAQDWAEMLLRMFIRYGERHGYKVELLDSLPMDEGGIKSATISISGLNAYGYLKSEKGVHRLVRISPYDTAGRRHTSFASVEVLPQVADDNEVEINADDLRIDTYRSSGKGGQHINKTDSAVRITHIPTGIVTQCQEERSQHSNKERAMTMLKARLLEHKLSQREAELAELRGEQAEIGWGSQIRSYVFQPYRLVKDHRTGCEAGNTDAVMDGAIDEFISAYLQHIAASRK
ncbi:MAG: peptide chain release factor 2 [Bacillota bacterium]|nr:peptide chain release factor 2 [Bacillota bacterium]